MSIFSRMIPNNNGIYFDFFNKASANVVEMANLLRDAALSDDCVSHKTQLNQIAMLNTRSYEIKHEVYAASGRAFVSPFERNDMYALVSSIKSVGDYIDNSARRINLYQMGVLSPYMKELAGLVADCAVQLQSAVNCLSNPSHSAKVAEHCKNVKDLEHYADKVYNKAFSQLIDEEKDSIQLIKQSDVLGALEKATDKCEHATIVIEGILIKNS